MHKWYLALDTLYLVIGTRYLVLGTWILVLGTWLQVIGTWHLKGGSPAKQPRQQGCTGSDYSATNVKEGGRLDVM